MSEVMNVLKQRFSRQLHDDLEAREGKDNIDWCDEMDKQFEKITGTSSHSAKEWAKDVSDEELKEVMIKAIGAVVKDKKLAPVLISPSREELEKAEKEKMKVTLPPQGGGQMFRTNRKTGGRFPVSTGFRPTYVTRVEKKKEEKQ